MSSGAQADASGGDGDTPAEGPVIRDRRRLDPDTGQVRAAYTRESGDPTATGHQSGDPDATDAGADPGADTGAEGGGAAQSAAQQVADERLADLQRLQAEFLNYKRRVERDRDLARSQAVATVLESLLPVLDGIHAARQAGDLEGGPFAAIAEKLESTLQRFGLARFGEPGETFDPTVHEALVHTEADLAEGTTDTTVVAVLQPGYRTDARVLRAARVAVADPS